MLSLGISESISSACGEMLRQVNILTAHQSWKKCLKNILLKPFPKKYVV